ncbi:MAG: hypothetical protein ACRBF0_19475 [Calditrichia bacterium]
MKKIYVWLLLGALLILNSSLAAQDSTKVKEEHSLKPGRWSLQFAINDSLDLRSFQGKNLSVKRQVTQKWALRFGLDLSAQLRKSEIESILDDNIPQDFLRENTDNSYSLLLSSVFIRYLKPESRTTFYWGAGPAFGVAFIDDIRKDGTRDGNRFVVSLTNEEKIANQQLGLLGVIGGEYFFKRRFSLFAEYQSGFFYTWSTTTFSFEFFNDYTQQNQRDESELRDREFSIDAKSITLGLSLYF